MKKPSNCFNRNYLLIFVILLSFSLIIGCKENDEIVPVPEPQALFEIGEIKDGQASFINLSKGATNYLWDFGDSITSIETNPSHQYSENGIYSVVLEAHNKDKIDYYSSSVEITDIVSDSWLQIENFPGGKRSKALYFKVDNKYYVGFGIDYSTHKKDLWEYSSITGTWTQKSDGPGPITGGVCFVIDQMVYLGLGVSNVAPNNRFWKYEVETDSWVQLNNFPGYGGHTTITGATSFSYNGAGYVINGNDTFTWEKEFWKYDPVNDSWQELDEFPGEARHLSSHFIIDNKVYICCGSNHLGGGNSSFYNDLWEFDFMTETWSQKADFPGQGRIGAVGFNLKNKGFIGLGWRNSSDYYNWDTKFYADIWEYDSNFDSWTERTSFTENTRVYSFVMEFENHVWIGTGKGGNNGNEKSDMWEYKIE